MAKFKKFTKKWQSTKANGLDKESIKQKSSKDQVTLKKLQKSTAQEGELT